MSSSHARSVGTAGYRAMRAAPDSATFTPDDRVGDELPPKVDMRPMMTAVEDQGRTSSCTANAVAGAYEYWVRRIAGQDHDISRLFVYYNARWRAGDEDEDAGSYIQLAMEGLGDFGACSEATWPFEKRLLLKKPRRNAYEEAATFRVRQREQVPLELDAWRRCLAEGKPIVFGCILFESFDQCNERGGVVPMPSREEVQRESHGGHAMCCVGYSDVDEVFIVRNSWGEEWGEDGYCYMPYNYLMNPKFNDGDCWVFIPDVPLPSPEDVWVVDDEPIVNRGRGVKFAINPYAIEDYESLEIDLFESIEIVEWYEPTSDTYVEYVDLVEEERFDELDDIAVEDVFGDGDEDEEYEEEDDSEDDSEDEESEEEESDEEEDESDEEYDEEEDDEEEDGEYEEDDGSDEEYEEESDGGEEYEEDAGGEEEE